MMSPRAPTNPIFSRDPSLSRSSASKSPRTTVHADSAFHTSQLPQPMYPNATGYPASRGFTGPVLPPISGHHTAGGGSPSQQTYHYAPHAQHMHPAQPYPPQTQSNINFRRVSGGLSRALSERDTAFSSPASPSPFSSPTPYSYEQRHESGQSQRYSTEVSPENRRERSNPPTYTSNRTPENGYVEKASFQVSGFAPNPLQAAGGFRQEMPPTRSASRYRIQVRQQPVAARACGFGERDRRVIDPPPIVQLIVNDASGHTDPAELRYPFNVVHCTLWSSNGLTDETALTGPDKRATRRLMGTLVSSPFVGQDEEGKEGCFFCFPDLSCRTHGQYRLRFVLMRLELGELQPGGFTPILTETISDVFTVYTAKEFPGMKPSTALTKVLKRQGCAISVKKGIEKPASGNEEEKPSGSHTNVNPRKRTASSRHGERS